MKKIKNNEPKITIPKEEIRSIHKEYDFSNTDKLLEYDDEMKYIIEKFEQLDPADKIIMELYAELKSQRKVGNILGVSRTTIIKCLNKIRNQILN